MNYQHFSLHPQTPTPLLNHPFHFLLIFLLLLVIYYVAALRSSVTRSLLLSGTPAPSRSEQLSNSKWGIWRYK